MGRPRSAWVTKCWVVGCACSAKAASAGHTARVLDADERAELERLRRENAELRLDREFFEKAAAFFVSEQNRRTPTG
jgi:transposase-like protein